MNSIAGFFKKFSIFEVIKPFQYVENNYFFKSFILSNCSILAQNNLILKFRPEFIDLPITEDVSKISYTFEELLNDEGDRTYHEYSKQTELFQFLPRNQTVFKVFGNLSWKDSLSITRFGDTIVIPPFWSCFSLERSASLDFDRIQKLLNESDLFQYIEVAPSVQNLSIPNDEFYPQQYSLGFNPSIPEASINIEEAWEMETGKSFIKIGVSDNGIDTLHPDLKVLYGANYHAVFNVNGDLYDNWGASGGSHGVPVAGIIAGKRNNGIGISGIAGGDNDSTGVSLIDLKLNFDDQFSRPAEYRMAAVVDAARSVGSYWQYPDWMYENQNSTPSGYFQQAPGFGVHAQNHSYLLYANIPTNIMEGKDINEGGTTIQEPCKICREAFIFSLKNGVINVVARGNTGIAPLNSDGSVNLTYQSNFIPQSLPDNWIISVGASGYDGTTVTEGVNQGYWDDASNFQSLRGGSMDLIAPGSDSIVYTSHIQSGNYGYRWFNGTSAAAPHVSGVVGLLLSYYNRDCYANQNLTMEDVEYILEKSATDVLDTGYDVTSAHGRLNAGKALKMIEYPKKQFVHPTTIINTTLLEHDTIALKYQQAITNDEWGPISRTFAPRQNNFYQVERLKYQLTYDYSSFISPTTEVLDVFPLKSRCNSLPLFNDTTNPPGPTWVFDVFGVNPDMEIVTNDTINHIVTTEGYYYHFINTYKPSNLFEIDTLLPINYWYPVNPFNTQPKMPVSIYLSDSTLSNIYGYNLPCDSINLLYDSTYQIPNLGLQNTNKEPDFWVYPNPSNGELKVLFSTAEKREIRIVNVLGEEVYSQSSNEKNLNLQLTFLPTGSFIVEVHSDQGQKRIKWVKL